MKVTPKKINIKQESNKLNKTEATTSDKPKEEKVKFKFLKAVWLVIKGENENTDFTSGIFAYFLSTCFNALFALGIIVVISIFIVTLKTAFNMEWAWSNLVNNVLNIATYIAILLICFLMSVMLRGAANEMEKETDRNFIIAVFSGVVSFAALIIALVT